MTFELAILILTCLGIAFSALLFYRFPGLPPAKNDNDLPPVSIIIPARNEEKNLQLLLEDLRKQSLRPHEIICVNDDSSDGTARIAQSFGATLINLPKKPEGWTGKSWACQNGADLATGSLLLFLDADVRLGENGISRLLQTHRACNCTISVQPYHVTEKVYEQFSLLFNLVQIAANGTSLPWKFRIGLHGPVLLISRLDYNKIGGHESVREFVVEDVALGQRLKEKQIPFKLFIGDEEISYRMYPEGLLSLFQGWVKNFASGAYKTSLPVLLMIFLWIDSMTNVPGFLARSFARGDLAMIAAYGLLYLVWVIILSVLAKKIGRFQPVATIFFPIQVLAFLVIFIISLGRKVLGLPVVWKGRVIAGEDKA